MVRNGIQVQSVQKPLELTKKKGQIEEICTRSTGATIAIASLKQSQYFVSF